MRIKRTTAIVAGVIGATWMTAFLALAKACGLTSLNLSLVLATLTTGHPSGDSWILGFALHLVIGAGVALVYAALFEAMGAAGPVRGLLVGLSHALFAGALLAILPAGGNLVTEAPTIGFMGVNHGWLTPPLFIAAHLLYGWIVGAVYRASPVPVRHYARPRARGLKPAHG